jgi:hypothetical protein
MSAGVLRNSPEAHESLTHRRKTLNLVQTRGPMEKVFGHTSYRGNRPYEGHGLLSMKGAKKMKMRLLLLSCLFLPILALAQPNKTEKRIEQSDLNTPDCYLMWINNLILPIMNDGATPDGSSACGGQSEMGYISQSTTVLFSGGFILSGYANDTLWANAVASASRVKDYIPGRVFSTPNDTVGIYVLDRLDQAFGPSWQEWRKAVALGADFYDGDGDSLYNPVDLNNNGQWDPGEDAPDLLGDQTAWMVINDGLPSTSRRWFAVTPKGIDVQISVFGYRGTQALGNVLYLRYRLINRGTVAQVLDSLFFSAWADPDVQVYTNDLVGSDTTRKAGYSWSASPSENLTYLVRLLQGPAAYIPGVTFVDQNSNGEYDPGEPALDTARVRNGPRLGIRSFPGAKNIDATSFVNYVSSVLVRRDPDNHIEARNYALGRLRSGAFLDPCTDPYGAVFEQPCASVDPRFWYSGNPDTLTSGFGWIYVADNDIRQILNTGPFQLKLNRPVDVIVAYVVGEGTNNRTSVTAAKAVADVARSVYDENFQHITSVGNEERLPETFFLGQNYPNPFNPTTKIRFMIRSPGKVVLKVYNILGQMVRVLTNDVLDAGIHEVELSGANMPSGVYFYRLQSGLFTQTRKMILAR